MISRVDALNGSFSVSSSALLAAAQVVADHIIASDAGVARISVNPAAPVIHSLGRTEHVVSTNTVVSSRAAANCHPPTPRLHDAVALPNIPGSRSSPVLLVEGSVAAEHIAVCAPDVSSNNMIATDGISGVTENPHGNDSMSDVTQSPEEIQDDDEDTPEPQALIVQQLGDDESWQDAFTLMLLYERIRGRGSGQVNCLDAVEEPAMILNAEQRKVIKTICHGLLFGFAGRDATENGDSNNACITKDFGELIENMQKVMNFRARFHADHVALSEEETGSLYVSLMNDWLKSELRPDQQYKKRSEQTSIFAAWTRNSFGSKPFFIAMLQAGLTMMPSGLPEHAQKYRTQSDRATICLQELVQWLARFADSVVYHKKKDSTCQARERSGSQYRQSGLTAEQKTQRDRRNATRQLLEQAKQIAKEMTAYEKNDYRHFKNPRSWYYLAPWEKTALEDLNSGKLKRDFEDAQNVHGGKVQADPFRMHAD